MASGTCQVRSCWQEAGGRGREGRKDVGKELQWAALPVLRRHQLNFKHHLLSAPIRRAESDIGARQGQR